MDNEKAMACEKKRSDVPVWHRYTLTIEEAAGYKAVEHISRSDGGVFARNVPVSPFGGGIVKRL